MVQEMAPETEAITFKLHWVVVVVVVLLLLLFSYSIEGVV